MRHVADMREAVQRDEAAQALRVMGRRDAILDPDHDLGRRLRRGEKAADVDRLSAALREWPCEPPLLRDQRPLSALAQGGPGERGTQRGRIGDQHVEPRRESRPRCRPAGSRRRRQRWFLRRARPARSASATAPSRLAPRDRAAATAPPSEWPTRCAALTPSSISARARRFDQRLEARFLAKRRESVAGQVDRQRRPRLGQQAMHRPPAIEIGAEAVQEHDRRALASLQPLAVDDAVERQRRRVHSGGAPSTSRAWMRPFGPEPFTPRAERRARARSAARQASRAAPSAASAYAASSRSWASAHAADA